MSEWIVARTKPNREKWACENISQLGYRFYLPRMLIMRNNQAVTRCLFPSYVFVEIESAWRNLMHAWGVSSIILNAEGPAIVRPADIEAIRAREDADGFVVLPSARRRGPGRFKNGEKVRVCDGPFSGFNGIYQESKDRDRVRILLDYLGRKTPVFIHDKLLEAAV